VLQAPPDGGAVQKVENSREETPTDEVEAAPKAAGGDVAQRLANVRMRLNQARNLNTKEAAEEKRRAAANPKAAAKKKRADERREEKKEQRALKEAGAVFVERRVLQESAEDAERREAKRAKRKAAPEGEVIFGEDNLRDAFDRRIENVYKHGASVVASNDAGDELEYGKAPAIPTDNVDNMVAELEMTVERREKFSRRRAFNEDSIDVDFINERNRKFNKKISRAFDEYTAEVKQSLERGTALQ